MADLAALRRDAGRAHVRGERGRAVHRDAPDALGERRELAARGASEGKTRFAEAGADGGLDRESAGGDDGRAALDRLAAVAASVAAHEQLERVVAAFGEEAVAGEVDALGRTGERGASTPASPGQKGSQWSPQPSPAGISTSVPQQLQSSVPASPQKGAQVVAQLSRGEGVTLVPQQSQSMRAASARTPPSSPPLLLLRKHPSATSAIAGTSRLIPGTEERMRAMGARIVSGASP